MLPLTSTRTTYLPNTFTPRALRCCPAGFSPGMTIKNRRGVAVVNEEFARKIFGSVNNAIGGYYKMPDGTRIQVVGVAENGKYSKLTEDPQLAMFLPIPQFPSDSAWLVVRSSRDPQPLGAAIRSTLHRVDAGLPVVIETRLDEIGGALFPAQLAKG